MKLETSLIDRPPGRVIVGMSGGVDSSVVAALLHEAGFDVVGVTMQIWHRSSAFEDSGASAGCCTVDAVDDARRVARRLGIPYYVPNFRQPFSVVVDNFATEYAAGRTPNPCVRCNQYVRFDGLLRLADELDAPYIATGHYARVEFDDSLQEYVLKCALDERKDQSYVLHTLQQKQLARILFPLGALRKSETRELARRYALPVAEKPDSQELCFVAGGDYRAFLRSQHALHERPGPVIDMSGNRIGTHEGLQTVTVGQRKGLGTGGGPARYVIELRPRDNAVVVGTRDDVAARRLRCDDLHFTGAHATDEFRAHVKVRYRTPAQRARIHLTDDQALITFDEPVWGPAPGQLAVFYENDRVLGGGTIQDVLRT